MKLFIKWCRDGNTGKQVQYIYPQQDVYILLFVSSPVLLHVRMCTTLISLITCMESLQSSKLSMKVFSQVTDCTSMHMQLSCSEQAPLFL